MNAIDVCMRGWARLEVCDHGSEKTQALHQRLLRMELDGTHGRRFDANGSEASAPAVFFDTIE